MSTFTSLSAYRIGSLAILGLLAAGLNPAFAFQVPDTPVFEPKIVVLLGEGGINAVNKSITASPLVEVRDQYDAPIAGAEVRFSLPRSGPGGVFANGTKDMSLVADTLGRAAMGEMHPIGKGVFEIRVSANYKGRNATAAILQTNFSTVSSAKKAGKTPGTSASDTPGATPIKLPPTAMAFSGGTAAVLAITAAAIGAGVYVLETKKLLGGGACALGALQSTLLSYASTENASCGDGDDDSAPACFSGAALAAQALNNYCSCAGATISSAISILASELQYLGYAVPAVCGASY